MEMNEFLLKKLKGTYKSVIPDWLLNILMLNKYNKQLSIGDIKVKNSFVLFISLIVITIIMWISYSINYYEPTIIVWIGVGVWVIFALSIFLTIGLILLNNLKISRLCKKNGISIDDWNNTVI